VIGPGIRRAEIIQGRFRTRRAVLA